MHVMLENREAARCVAHVVNETTTTDRRENMRLITL